MEYGIIAGLIGVSTLLGLIWKSRQGRVVAQSGSTISLDYREAGKTTIIQFTTEMCSPCAQLKPRLQQIANFRSDVAYRDLDAVENLELANRLSIRSTPTTLIVSPDGEIRARVNGIATADVFINAIDGNIPTRSFTTTEETVI
jgi:thiol-disulfide isomerase/thioredoxin